MFLGVMKGRDFQILVQMFSIISSFFGNFITNSSFEWEACASLAPPQPSKTTFLSSFGLYLSRFSTKLSNSQKQKRYVHFKFTVTIVDLLKANGPHSSDADMLGPHTHILELMSIPHVFAKKSRNTAFECSCYPCRLCGLK